MNDTSYFNCNLFDSCNKCSNGVLINNGSCSINTKCIENDNMRCNKCPDGNYFNGNECEECDDNCLICNNRKCELCEYGFILNEFKCFNINEISNCKEFGETTCLRCSSGYYYNSNETKCELCSERI